MEDIVEIRGHHLDFLHPLIELLDAKSLDKDAYIRLIMLDGYGEKYANKTLELTNMLYNNEVKVKITTGMDDICLADCQKIKNCIGDIQLANLDRNVALHYNLEPEKVYSSREIIEILRKKGTYHERVHSFHIDPYK